MAKLKIEEIDYHRNGVAGEGFHVVKFREGRRKMLGVVFSAEMHIAVFDRDLLAQDCVTFGVNSWRGDDYDSRLREAIKAYWDAYDVAQDIARRKRDRAKFGSVEDRV